MEAQSEVGVKGITYVSETTLYSQASGAYEYQIKTNIVTTMSGDSPHQHVLLFLEGYGQYRPNFTVSNMFFVWHPWSLFEDAPRPLPR